VTLTYLELDLDVFTGPFDLLLTLILREEVDLLEVDLADVVITYIDHLQAQTHDSRDAQSGEAGCRARGEREELDLEAATEFLVLIAALLELKSRLLLPGEEVEEIDLDPGEAAEELLARLLAAQRYRAAAAYLAERLEDEEGFRFRSAPLPPQLRKASLRDAGAVYDPGALAGAIGDLLQVPPPVDVGHMTVARITVAERLVHLRALLSRGRFTFSEAVGRADRVTVAVTLYALLELYKQGEATWIQEEPFAEITVLSLSRADRLRPVLDAGRPRGGGDGRAPDGVRANWRLTG
jgi:segregation and condensation protein A